MCDAIPIANPNYDVRVGFWQNGFFADFCFWAAGFLRGFSRRIFSPHFCGKKCPEKSSRKIPGKTLQKLYRTKSPTHFCRGAGPNDAKQFFSLEMRKPSSVHLNSQEKCHKIKALEHPAILAWRCEILACILRSSDAKMPAIRALAVVFQGKIIYAPPPPTPFLVIRHFSGEGGGGVYFEAPRGRNFIRPPPFYTPPAPRRVFSGVGGGVYKIWPRRSGPRCERLRCQIAGDAGRAMRATKLLNETHLLPAQKQHHP